MRKLNRALVASALAVPMALGTSGVAMADVAEGSPAAQNLAEEDNSSNESDDNLDLNFDDEDSEEGNSGEGDDSEDIGQILEDLLEELFGGGNGDGSDNGGIFDNGDDSEDNEGDDNEGDSDNGGILDGGNGSDSEEDGVSIL